jgi:hypothetical protein
MPQISGDKKITPTLMVGVIRAFALLSYLFKNTCLITSVEQSYYALPKIRLTLVPHTGQIPCAIRRPDSETFT